MVSWMATWSRPNTLAMVDAPLVVENPTGQRLCEKQVGQRFGRWKVSANTTNLGSPNLAGVHLREQLEASGWHYDDGRGGPPSSGHVLSDVYPYTTIVGACELGYETERPRYTSADPTACRLASSGRSELRPMTDCPPRWTAFVATIPPLDLRSHPVTAKLLQAPSPASDREYKHREDLLDAALCAWTGLLWLQRGLDGCQVLGLTNEAARQATIIAPARGRTACSRGVVRDTSMTGPDQASPLEGAQE